MFSPRSRYFAVTTDTVVMRDGREVTMVRFPTRRSPPLQGYHRRLEGQRLDHISAHYLKDAAAFWRLCDGNDAISPDALSARELIGIPIGER